MLATTAARINSFSTFKSSKKYYKNIYNKS